MAEEKQVLVRFTTKLPVELQVPATEVAVPASLKRYGLSQIINHLLALEPVRPFDFIVDGELVRRSLEQHLLEHSISPESVVEIEYVPAVIPPEHKQAIPQDDWVMAVAAAAHNRLLLSGSADGVVRLWSAGGDCLHEFAAHKLGVNALAAVEPAQQQQQQKNQQHTLLLSAGKDHSLRLWEVQAAQVQQSAGGGRAAGGKGSSARCAVQYEGHREAVQAVAASPGGAMCCSGGWDGQLLVWRTGQAVMDEAAAAAAAGDAGEDPAAAAGKRKKQKLAGGGGAAASAPLQLQPAAALPGHVHCVAAVAWPSRDVLFSGGWDHSVRRYDVEARANTDTCNGSKAVYAVAAPSAADGGGGSDVVAFGGSDRVLRIWDTRGVAGEGLAVKAHNAHEGWISALAWRPGSGHQLASGGHDGVVKLWDVRTPVPLAALSQHGEGGKVLDVAWAGTGTLLSGGSDCSLQVYAMVA